ncbi:hypothetical protein Leryth_018959 [Lithospermum erythrorhizon]|nr:hypothetical protein Leryth_018959 [Lithospermum erythrorhizon]
MSGGDTCPLRRSKSVEEAVIPMDMEVADTDEDKICPNSILSQITNSPPNSLQITNIPQQFQMDFYTQAFKALSYHSPFDAPDAVVRLPSRLAQLLNRNTDGKNRQRKLHSDYKKSSKRSEKTRGSNLWIETEDYFRELTVEDVEKLHRLSNLSFSGNERYFTIPKFNTADSKTNSGLNGNNGIVNFTMSNGVEVKEEMPIDDQNLQQCMDLDSVANEVNTVELGRVDNMEVEGQETQERINGDKDDRGSCAFSGVEWLLGSRSKIYLTSERPSKKRKLLGGDAGLEKLLVARPVEGSRTLCHYCSLADTGDQLNRLIVCSTCGVAVHQRCYGVQEDVRDSWFCSWCKQKMKHNMQLNAERPCSLCSKKNGALKLARKRDSGSESDRSLEFVHLFCCQWIPEVYVENTRTMEPIMNMDAVKDTRRKLVCYLCKDKCGACVRCSNGACRTSFHPICAREAMHRMEIWGKLGYDEVELRAFCCKHSEAQSSSSSSSQHIRATLTTGSNSLSLRNGPVLSSSTLPKLKIGLDNEDMMLASADTVNSESDLSKRKDDVYQEDLADSTAKFKFKNDVEHAVLKEESLVKNFDKDVHASDSLNFIMILNMLVERGKVDLKDVANDTGIPVDVLASEVTGICVSPDLHSKIVKWLKDHTHLGSLRKPLKVKIKSPKAETDVGDPSIISVVKPDTTHVVPVKSVPPRRRTNSSLRILEEDTVPNTLKEVSQNDGMGLNEFKMEEQDFNNRGPPSNDQEKILRDSMNTHDICMNDSFDCEGYFRKKELNKEV